MAFRAFGNVDYAHDLLLTAGPGRPPGPRVVPAVLGRQGGHRRDPQAADRGLHARAGRTRAVMSPEVVALVDKRWKEYGLS